jgi:DNA polymerase IV (family X)
MELDKAFGIAEEYLAYFRPACERILIAGSIRRKKPQVKDIELVAIPDLTIAVPRPRLEFGKPEPVLHKTMLDSLIHDLVLRNEIVIEKSGERYKKFTLKRESISVDLFLVLPPATWGVQFVIRTGPFDFSHWIVSRQKNGGALPNGFRVQGGAVWHGEHETKTLEDEVLIGFDTEKDFLEFLGLGWIEPSERVARWKK